jgi:hypothetical protein
LHDPVGVKPVLDFICKIMVGTKHCRQTLPRISVKRKHDLAASGSIWGQNVADSFHHLLPFLISRVAVYSELGKTLSFSLIADYF